jgi:pseudaminic acid synthase
MQEILIAGRAVSPHHPPFIVAEMSGNHNQSLDRALAIVEAAAKAGAHALKLQTYTADTMTLDLEHLRVDAPNSLWKGQKLYDLYKLAATPWEWHEALLERCRALGMVGFSTPFDASSVQFLESLEVPCYKIASFEVTDLPLLKVVAKTGKPVIMSTGMATLAELDTAVRTLRESGCKDLILLKCTSSYPAEPTDSNLMTLPHLQALFQCQVGLSDHTLGIGVSVASVALGARLIERHFTLDRTEGGVDAAFSLEPQELSQLAIESRRAFDALGQVVYGPITAELEGLQYRRSLYIVKDMQAGEVFSEENVKILRPASGMSPAFFEWLLGKSVKYNVHAGTPVAWEMLV